MANLDHQQACWATQSLVQHRRTATFSARCSKSSQFSSRHSLSESTEHKITVKPQNFTRGEAALEMSNYSKSATLGNEIISLKILQVQTFVTNIITKTQ